MRLGVMGGTFDPIHLGHLRAAESAREGLGLDRVAFVPCRVPPHRREPSAPALDRFAMVCLATSGSPRFAPSDLELLRDGPSYTVDTLTLLAAQHPEADLVLIVGSDTLPELPSWKDSAGIFARCAVAVVGRPGAGARAAAPAGARMLEVPGPGLAVSSTEVREALAAGRSVRYLVPEPVADYIEKRGLYR